VGRGSFKEASLTHRILASAACVVVGSLLLVSGAGLLVSCAGGARSTHQEAEALRAKIAPVTPPAVTAEKPADFAGVHNVVAYHDGYYSGSVPEGDAGFDTLVGMGVRTIISVDGAEPELAAAKARGMRYIHLPIGYNGFDEQRKLELARATRDAMKDGPVYIHCHHGKHRSAGAAAAVVASLGWATPEQGVARMKVSGTSPNYTGLYQCALESVVVSATALNAVPADFPEVSKPAGFVATMVEVDQVFDHLSDIERAGWVVPAEHPDLVPAAEAGRLVDLFRAAHASKYSKTKPADFGEMFEKDIARAQSLEDLIVAGGAPPEKLSATFKPIGASCKECHSKHRDKAPW
jgi:hypothetical protein